MSAWVKRRTCSRVSSGPCDDCHKHTYRSAWQRRDETLCVPCYEARFEPAKAEERRAAVGAAETQRKVDLALALEDKLPGAKVAASGAVFGPPRTVLGGLVCRQVLREGLYDTTPFVSDTPKESP